MLVFRDYGDERLQPIAGHDFNINCRLLAMIILILKHTVYNSFDYVLLVAIGS